MGRYGVAYLFDGDSFMLAGFEFRKKLTMLIWRKADKIMTTEQAQLFFITFNSSLLYYAP